MFTERNRKRPKDSRRRWGGGGGEIRGNSSNIVRGQIVGGESIHSIYALRSMTRMMSRRRVINALECHHALNLSSRATTRTKM